VYSPHRSPTFFFPSIFLPFQILRIGPVNEWFFGPGSRFFWSCHRSPTGSLPLRRLIPLFRTPSEGGSRGKCEILRNHGSFSFLFFFPLPSTVDPLLYRRDSLLLCFEVGFCLEGFLTPELNRYASLALVMLVFPSPLCHFSPLVGYAQPLRKPTDLHRPTATLNQSFFHCPSPTSK